MRALTMNKIDVAAGGSRKQGKPRTGGGIALSYRAPILAAALALIAAGGAYLPRANVVVVRHDDGTALGAVDCLGSTKP